MKKSTRNRKSCHTPELSAGDATSTHCPPALKKSLKTALLNEIRNFSEKDARKEIEASGNGGAARDAYTDWLYQNGGHEPSEANPDVLSEDDGIKFLPSKKDSQMATLLMEIRQSFSLKERQVWNLVMRHNISQRDAADLLHMTVGSLQRHLQRARDKFTKYMEAAKHG